MKPPVILAIVIVIAGSVWGVKETHHLTKVREQHRLVMIEAAGLGISADVSESAVVTKASMRVREDGSRKAKEFAEQLVSFAREMKEMQESGKQPDEAMQKRIMDMMDGMLALNGGELKLLIVELRGRKDMDDEMRQGMISFSIIMLSQKNPEAALALFTESSDLLGDSPMSKHALSSALSQWAKDQPLEALKWIKENAEKHPDLANDDAKEAVIGGAAQNDLGLAIQLVGELKLSVDDSGVMSRIARAAVTPGKQMELLELLRRQAGSQADKGEGGKLLTSGLDALFSQVTESGYDKTMAWVEGADLSTEESGRLARGLNYYQTKEDTGKWLGWVSGLGMKPDETESTTRNLVQQWTQKDYKKAGEWLAAADSSPVKEHATMAYLEAVAPYDPEVAAQWAETLPEAKRKDAMSNIHRSLKRKDEVAAQDFAARHGVDVEQ